MRSYNFVVERDPDTRLPPNRDQSGSPKRRGKTSHGAGSLSAVRSTDRAREGGRPG